jgi:hypothetical protein
MEVSPAIERQDREAITSAFSLLIADLQTIGLAGLLFVVESLLTATSAPQKMKFDQLAPELAELFPDLGGAGPLTGPL